MHYTYIYPYIYTQTYIYIYRNIHADGYMCIRCIHMCMNICMHTEMHMCVYACVYTENACLYVFTCACACAREYTCVCTNSHNYTFTHVHGSECNGIDARFVVYTTPTPITRFCYYMGSNYIRNGRFTRFTSWHIRCTRNHCWGSGSHPNGHGTEHGWGCITRRWCQPHHTGAHISRKRSGWKGYSLRIHRAGEGPDVLIIS